MCGFLGHFHACADRSLEAHAHAAVVGGGEEFRADLSDEHERTDECGHTYYEGHHFVAHYPVEEASVAAVEGIESAVDGGEEQVIELAVVVLPAQQERAEHRSEREGAGGGDDHHDGHHPAELAEEYAGHAGDEGQREEHRYKCQRGRDDRYGHLVGAVHGGLLRIGAALDVRRHVLEHHDGVVHHHTDGYRQGRERHDVQRVARGVEIYERGDERYRYCDGDDERGAPASEEGEHHYNHEEQGVHHRLDQRVDGVADVVRRVGDYAELDVGGQTLLERGQHLQDFVGNFHGVGAALLLYHYHGALLAVVECLLGALLKGVFDACHVAQIDGAVARCAHDDVGHLVGRGELALHAQRVGVRADVERAAGDVAVLGADDGAYLLDGEVVCFKAHGVDVDVYLALGGAGYRHRAHAADTRQRIGHGVVENLIEARHTLGGAYRQDDDGNHVGGELEDDRVLRFVGEHGRYHVELVSDVVGEHVDVLAVLEFKGDDRYVLARLRRDVLQVADGVEDVLERTGHVLLDVLCAGARVGGHDHDGVGLDIGVEVDRQALEREKTEYHHGHEAQRGHDRALDGATV